jgi:hypothetical protein
MIERLQRRIEAEELREAEDDYYSNSGLRQVESSQMDLHLDLR